MTFRKLLLLGGIGGFVYAHRKRGGQMTLDSFKQTGREFLDMAKSRVDQIKSQAESRLQGVKGESSDVQSDVIGKPHVESGGSFADDVTGYGSSGYGYGSTPRR